MKLVFLVFQFSLCGVFVQASFFSRDENKVDLKDIEVLTFYPNRMTAFRRTSAVPQMACVGGDACRDYTPSVVQCYNKGSDGYDVQWECKADMPVEFRFGAINVGCEGYSSSEDMYVLRGSCGLEYELHRVAGTQQQQNQQQYQQQNQQQNHHQQYQDPDLAWEPPSRKSVPFMGNSTVILFLLIAAAVWCFCKQRRPANDNYRDPSNNNGRFGNDGGRPPHSGNGGDGFE